MCYHKDQYEAQGELTDGRLRFAEINRSALIRKVKSIVCREAEDPLQTVNSYVTLLSEQGSEVEVSAAAFMASRFRGGAKSRDKLFEKLFGG